jgi:hypothetical protein
MDYLQDFLYCLHPTCEQLLPHRHVYLSEYCKEGRYHQRCQGHSAITTSTVMTEDHLIQQQRRQLQDLCRGDNPDQKALWQMQELHRQQWDRLVHGDKMPASKLNARKVWVCSCECHDEVRRALLLAEQWNRHIKPWDLPQEDGHDLP